MYAMILAAGKGERMMPLSLATPKPLLEAGGKPLLQYHLESLARASVSGVVINTGRLGHQIEARFGNGTGLGLAIEYSHEGNEPLGTGGGILKALPLLGESPFILVNGDVWTDFDFRTLSGDIQGLAHLVMVANPEHHPEGDFVLKGRQLQMEGSPRYTYSGIGVYRPGLFALPGENLFSFVPLLKTAINRNQVSGEIHPGLWFDIGTPQRLGELQKMLQPK
jgi:MurNAc alpha-1-phosphate uridylyltransferase